METNINIKTINYYFSRGKEIKTQIEHNKIVNYSYFSINEVTICHKIEKIPYYSNFFNILKDYDELNLSQLNENIIEKLKPTEDTKYYLFKYADKNSIDFIDAIYSSTCIKKLIFDLIHSFEHLVYGLHLLNENNICFFDVSPKNISFLQDFREKPVLSNFKFSLNTNKLTYTNLSHILNKLENFTFQPLEIHILYYFVKHHMVTISYSFIEEFCEDFMNSLPILRLFSDNYKTKYKEQCVQQMRKYINLSRTDIINDILERNNKWDVYGISMIFIQLFGCISRIFFLKGTFMSKITLELSKNLHPDSDKRMSLEETLNVFNKYLNEEKDWKYINNLDNNKLTQLFDEFEK